MKGSGARATQIVTVGLARYPFFIQHREHVTEIGEHTQPGVEINIAHAGAGEIVVSGRREVMVRGRVAIFPGACPHGFAAQKGTTYVRSVLCVDPSRLPYGSNLVEALVVSNVLAWALTDEEFAKLNLLCTELDVEMREQKPVWSHTSLALLLSILAALKRSAISASAFATSPVSTALPHHAARRQPRNIVHDCRSYIQTHLDDPLSLSSLAQTLHVSRSHLARIFRKETGMSVHEYIAIERFAEAKRLLATEAELSVTEIAFRVGYTSLSHFSRAFRGHTGQSPLAYRRSLGQA